METNLLERSINPSLDPLNKEANTGPLIWFKYFACRNGMPGQGALEQTDTSQELLRYWMKYWPKGMSIRQTTD